MKFKWFHWGSRTKERSCDGKVRYGETSALEAAGKMSLKKQTQFDAYKCDFCNGYHIGHRWKLEEPTLGEGTLDERAMDSQKRG